MAWFDHKEAAKLTPAHFEDVTPRQRRQPSWLSYGRRHSAQVTPVSLPRPPLIPSEMAGRPPQVTVTSPGDIATRYKTKDPRDSVSVPGGEDPKPSMSPAELETLVAERAIRPAVDPSLEINRIAIMEAIQCIVDAHDRMTNDLTARAVDLATLIARRVIAREVRTHKDIVVDLVREGLEVLNVRDRVRVHLGPEFAVMQNELAAHYSAMGTVMDVIIDSTLPAYGCVVETDVGSVDESIESRIDALLEVISDGREA